MTLCVGCHRQIDPAFVFCPGCGSDNRDPLNRPPIPAHVHDYRGEGHCILCGQQGDFDPGARPKNGYSFDTNFFDLWHRVLGVGATIGLAWGWYAQKMNYNASDSFERALASPYPTIAAALITLVLFLGRFRTNIDCDSRRVFRSTGFWPAAYIRMYRFEDFNRIAVSSRYVSTRYSRSSFLDGNGYYLYNPSLVRADGQGSVPIATDLRHDSLDRVTEVAVVMNLPVDSLFDQTLL